ncbi:MAG: sulfotransferase [Candidatus Altiarchaeota archaeon]|nr:sulfotransferase [Candidatus Altiarchaeota archaeon]
MEFKKNKKKAWNVKKPNFFIVGQPRCGTTAIYLSLKAHPQIYMPEIKEPSFFSKDLNAKSMSNTLAFVKSYDGYLQLFENVKDEIVIGEASTNYLYSKVAAKEIYKFNHAAKIIIILREPIDFLSSYCQFVKCSVLEKNPDVLEYIKCLEDALNVEEPRKKTDKRHKTKLLPYYEIIKYAEQIKRYYKYFPKDQVKIIIYDDFREDNKKILGEILSFLGADTHYPINVPKANTSKTVRDTNISAFFKFFFKTFISRVYSSRELYFFLKKLRLNSVYRLLFNNVYLKNNPDKRIDESLRLKLMKKYKTEVVKASELIGINLVKKWGYDVV